MSSTAYALTGFVCWALFLLVLMETIRTYLVVTGKVAANGRLARAHANCIEGLPLFDGLLAIAIMTSRAAVTDGLALWLFGARIAQSIIHLVSTNSIAVSLRFAAFAVQIVIGIYWPWRLLA